MHYYQFNVGDYVLATKHLGPMEDLVYRRIIDLYYTSEQPILLDTKRVAKLISLPDDEKIVKEILSEFFEKTDSGWTNYRCELIIAEYRKLRQVATKAGIASGISRNFKLNDR